jgi:HEAT repeat protein
MFSTEDRIKALIEDLKSSNPEIVTVAEDTLVEIGPPAIHFLIKELNNYWNYFRRRVEKVLARLGEPALEHLTQEILKEMVAEYGNNTQSLVRPMALFGEAAIEPLFEIIKKDIGKGRIGSPVQNESPYVFEKIGEPAKTFLLKNLTDPDPENRSAAILGLYFFKNKEIINAIINALDDPDETVRGFAESGLGDSETLDYLIEAQNKTSNSGLKKKINDIIEEIGRRGKFNFL